jgi:hypothetical protein
MVVYANVILVLLTSSNVPRCSSYGPHKLLRHGGPEVQMSHALPKTDPSLCIMLAHQEMEGCQLEPTRHINQLQ